MIGKTVSHYKILEKIGSGGMGDVYKAEDTKLQRLVALKFLPNELTRDEEARQRFIQEARAASIIDHPNIGTIHEIDEEDGHVFIVMAYYSGETLKKKIEDNRIEIDEAVSIVMQCCKALSKAHAQGIIHRDIKPANIMLTDEGEVKIIDFGLAKLRGHTMMTRVGTTLGTVSYMSPEQAQGKDIDHKTDLWSLGVILYEMLTGEKPFQGDYEQSVIFSILSENPKPVDNLNSKITSDLRDIVQKSLEKDLKVRYPYAGEMLKDLLEYQRKQMKVEASGYNIKLFSRRLLKPKIMLSVVGAIILIVLMSIWLVDQQKKKRMAREILIPEINRLIETGLKNYVEAYNLAVEAEMYVPDDVKLKELLSKCSVTTSIFTSPPGAEIYIKVYNQAEKEWSFLGTTPIENIRLCSGYYRWKITKEGYETVTAMASGARFSTEKGISSAEIKFILDKVGTLPDGMVRIAYPDTLDNFLIDKYEVTNEQFKEFIDDGGYRNKEFWKHPFKDNGKYISWENAVLQFVDQTGRPGPATWLAGVYPDGKEYYPVSGISWYEAAAYAEYKGKSLPTISHWNRARDITSLYLNSYLIISQSNFGSNGPAPVGSYQGLTSNGVYDMAGNVREWCWNETRLGRCIRGGAWNDYLYMFTNISHINPFNRADKNGFRCVIYLERDKISEDVFKPHDFEKRVRDYTREKPVTEEIFQIYKDLYTFDPKDLDSKIEYRNTNFVFWIKERISFTAAYGDERIYAILFLPKHTKPPYQAVIYFPGSSARNVGSSETLENKPGFQYYLDHIVRNNRAVVFPIYKGTFERRFNEQESELLAGPHQYANYKIQLVKDLSRVIDYLETRQDIDIDKIAYCGLSWGAGMGQIIPAIESRFKASILIVGGMSMWKPRPEVDGLNFITRVKIPTLMLNGKYDMVFSYDKSVMPMFNLFGTPKDDKKLVLFDSDHFIPRKELIKETLDWLDKYLGPVN